MKQNRIQYNLNPPPYLQQAIMLKLLVCNEIIDSIEMLDYAGGYGTLNTIFAKYFNLKLLIYDPFIQNVSTKYLSTRQLGKYKTVFNSAMFEHITSRENLEDINNLVDDNGCLILHTVVCEKIPKDSDWFYLEPPVHCAFHTNKSMEILMKQWGYTASIYSPVSKCWVLLKNGGGIYEKLQKINNELQENYFFYKKGFVDYWKGF
jgi:hypothetical protein